MSIESRSRQFGKVFDHWQIREFLGQGSGGKSAVFGLVHSSSSAIKSALKVVSLIEERGRESELSNFRRGEFEIMKQHCKDYAEQEVLLMNGLQGRTNIVDYLDHTFVDWADETGFGCDMLIRMELLKDLRGQLKSGKHFTQKEIIKIGQDICTALILCHGKSILHRDIKPENIFYNSDGNYKLGDFGISRILSAAPLSVASTGIGTPQYWAPEQTSGKYDKRVDIYSLGLVLYELSNQNRLPFAASSYVTEADLQKRMMGTPLPVPNGVSQDLAQVILKACAFHREDRYATADAFLDALNRLEQGQSQSAYGFSAQDLNQTVAASALAGNWNQTQPGSASDMDWNQTQPAVSAGSWDQNQTIPATGKGSSQTQWARPAPQPAPDPPQKPQQLWKPEKQDNYHRNKIPLILGIAAVLALILGFILFGESPEKQPKPEETTGPAESTELICDHKWTDMGCLIPPVCGLCGISKEMAPGHQWAEATSYTPKTCTVCEQTEGSPLIQPGDMITFGRYEQDNNYHNGSEAIQWRVLAVEENRVLVISQYAIECFSYHTVRTGVTWESSRTRQWLNSDFFYSAFTEEEQARIHITEVTASPNPWYGTYAGSDTEDRVFLLSTEDAETFFSDGNERLCSPTPYTIAQGTYVNPSTGGCWWWLRTPGISSADACSVNSDGSIDYDDGTVTSSKGAIRPALWLELSE